MLQTICRSRLPCAQSRMQYLTRNRNGIQSSCLRNKSNCSSGGIKKREGRIDDDKPIEDDGYGYSRTSQGGPISKFLSSTFSQPPKPGALILVRHGESEWNKRRLFTGWVDVDLSERGIREVEHASRLLLERGYTADIVYTSMLKRAVRSSWILLNELNQIHRPVVKSWRLNERMYGALEGHSKPALANLYGEPQVQRWRAGLEDRPPEMTPDHIYSHTRDRKYSKLPRSMVPTTESLQDTIDRTIPLWYSHILPDLEAGRNVMIVAHRNSIRAIVKHIDGIGTNDIQKMSVPNGIPLVYKFDPTTMKPLLHEKAQPPLSGIWLEKKGLLRAALEREEQMALKIAGYEDTNEALQRGKAYYQTTAADGPTDAAGTSADASTNDAPGSTGNMSGDIADVNTNSPPPTSTGTATAGATTTSSSSSSGSGGSHTGNMHTHAGEADLISKLTKLEQERVFLKMVDDQRKESIPDPHDLDKRFYGYDDTTAAMDLFLDPKVLGQEELLRAKGKAAGAGHAAVEAVPLKDVLVGNEPAPVDVTRLNQIHYFDHMTCSESASGSSSQSQEEEGEVNEAADCGGGNGRDPILSQPLLVIIRHGKTEHNKLGLFTGWEDAGLAPEGRHEARAAGNLLRRHQVDFDIVYASWLSRAIETALLVINELDTLWIPVVKTWRLNERMYGALTGLSKKMIRQMYGDEQFMRWRRGFDEPPPAISSFSEFYPGNDSRYVDYVQDVPVSIWETLIRSLAHGKFELHRAFPKRESLKDCMDRTIPYFLNEIKPDSIDKGKTVLVASSENAIRGLLMHLCEIPSSRIHALEIPTGLPLIYDPNLRKIRLLQENPGETGRELLERYNFGASPELLFKVDGPSDGGAAGGGSSQQTMMKDDDIIIRLR